MTRAVECYIERTFNLGDYQSLKVGFRMTIAEGEQPLMVSEQAEQLIHQHYQNYQAKAGKTGPTSSNIDSHISPQKPPSPPTTRFKTDAPKADRQMYDKATICPKCGGYKKPQYELCYTCHEEEKAT